MSHDHVAVAKQLVKLSGLEAMRALIAGQYPPPSIAATLGFWLAEVNDGRALFLGEPSDRIMNPLGIVPSMNADFSASSISLNNFRHSPSRRYF